MNPASPRITVLGSINMDLVIRCANLPAPGQTILADSAAEICGGKGANQAVAAAKVGGNVTMVGRVGDDAFAERLVDNLRQHDIACKHVHATSQSPSGVAIVAVEDSGQNSIMVVPGANGRLTTEDVEAARATIESSDILLVQLEVPVGTVLAAIKIAVAAGVRVVLDPAPAPVEFPAAILQVDLICPNESEAAAIVGHDMETIEQIDSAARELHRRGAKNVAITLGERGTLLFDGEDITLVESHKIDAVDTTAAGDAFAGALAVSWSQGNSLLDAVRFANAAGAVSASRAGAQPSMASREEIATLQNQSN
jgi:ribokinase